MISFFVTMGRLLQSLYRGFREPEFVGLFLFVLLLITSGSIFYWKTEQWSFIDSVYFTVTTLTTVGSNMTPRTDLGKIFTIVYLFVGLGSVAGFIAAVARHSRSQYPDIHKLTERLSKFK